MFLLACFALPFAIVIKIVHPGVIFTLRKGFELAQHSPLHGSMFVLVLLAYGSCLMFFVNGAFVFLRAAAGYNVRRNGSIAKWILNKFKNRSGK